jgi:hypothetical protein
VRIDHQQMAGVRADVEDAKSHTFKVLDE